MLEINNNGFVGLPFITGEVVYNKFILEKMSLLHLLIGAWQQRLFMEVRCFDWPGYSSFPGEINNTDKSTFSFVYAMEKKISLKT